MPTKTLITLSGGLDSTYIAWRLLSTTTDDITAHHYDQSMLTDAGRPTFQSNLATWQEKANVNIISWFDKNIRPLNYTRQTVKNDEIIMSDMSASIHMLKDTARKVLTGEFDLIYFGYGQRRMTLPNFVTRNESPLLLTGPNGIYRNAFASVAGDSLALKFPILDWATNVAMILEELPADLYALTDSCTKPLGLTDDGLAVRCGACVKCIVQDIARFKLDDGLPASEFGQWLSHDTDVLFTYVVDGLTKSISFQSLFSSVGREYTNFIEFWDEYRD